MMDSNSSSSFADNGNDANSSAETRKDVSRIHCDGIVSEMEIDIDEENEVVDIHNNKEIEIIAFDSLNGSKIPTETKISELKELDNCMSGNILGQNNEPVVSKINKLDDYIPVNGSEICEELKTCELNDTSQDLSNCQNEIQVMDIKYDEAPPDTRVTESSEHNTENAHKVEFEENQEINGEVLLNNERIVDLNDGQLSSDEASVTSCDEQLLSNAKLVELNDRQVLKEEVSAISSNNQLSRDEGPVELNSRQLLGSEVSAISDDTLSLSAETSVDLNNKQLSENKSPKETNSDSSNVTVKKGRKRKREVEKLLLDIDMKNANDVASSMVRKRTRSTNTFVSNVEEPQPKKDYSHKRPYHRHKVISDAHTLNSELNFAHKGLGEKLGNIPLVRKLLQESEENMQHLYHVLFGQLNPDKIHEAHDAVLAFNGFPFGENSLEFNKRKRLLKNMPDSTVAFICKAMGLNKGSKLEMVSDILKFLMKPHVTKEHAKDSTMQPFVRINRISLVNAYVQKSPRKIATRRSTANKEIVKRQNTANEESVKRKAVDDKVVVARKLTANKEKEVISKLKYVKVVLEKFQGTVAKNTEVVRKPGRKKKMKRGRKRTLESSGLKDDLSFTENKKQSKELKSTEDLTEREDISKKELNLQEKEESIYSAVGDESDVIVDDVRDDKSSGSPKKSSKKLMKYKGKPLKMFPKVSQSIKEADFSALQRLHILLFGAADKAENLKANILAFGGFPFLDKSSEWKQKEFLLSLLAKNTLRDYLNLLCIDYNGDDQATMISKLMRFLEAPNESFLEPEVIDIETEVVSSELTHDITAEASSKTGKKKRKKKEKKSDGRRRKVLMDEAQVRRLEADIAREQRILAREKKIQEQQAKKFMTSQGLPVKESRVIPVEKKPLQQTGPPKPPTTDPEQLNALLQTVYKRRALKSAGVHISPPNKTRTKLGDLPNVKFLVVTANYNELDILHHLIFMVDANKAKVRKNILDFDGFGFTEESKQYGNRMQLLNRLGHAVSKRIAFLLGLCPLETNIPQQDLNELIMYFLMSPCHTKEIPITQMPQTFISRSDVSKELSALSLNQNVSGKKSPPKKVMPKRSPGPSKKKAVSAIDFTTSTAVTSAPVSNVSTPVSIVPSAQVTNISAPVSTVLPVSDNCKEMFKISKAKKTLGYPKVPMSVKLPPVKKVVLSGGPSVLSNAAVNVKPPAVVINKPIESNVASPVVLSQLPGTPTVQLHSVLQSPPLSKGQIITSTVSSNSSPPEELYVQQQTPDGQQKIYKLVRVPTSQSLVTVKSAPQIQIPQSSSQIHTQPLTLGTPISALPPGIIVIKSNQNQHAVVGNQTVPSILQTVPIVINPDVNRLAGPTVSSHMATVNTTNATSKKDEFVLPDSLNSKSAGQNDWDDEVEILNPLENNDEPTDEELYASIQEVILNANFEHITLRNVIDRVAAQYSKFDLTRRHGYMKDCVKRIIVGT